MIRSFLYKLKLRLLESDRRSYKLDFFDCFLTFPEEKRCTVMRASIKKYGVYEPETTRYVLGLPDFNKAVDVGANYGYYSLLLSHKSDVLVCFEPQKEALRVLKYNLECFGGRAEVAYFGVLLWSCNGTKEFYVSSNSGGSTLNREYAKRKDWHTFVGSEVLPVYDASSFITGSVDLLKIDVEGSEYNILKVLKVEKIKRIIVEIETRDNQKKINNLLKHTHKLVKVLDKRNYVYEKRDGGEGV